jgi:hypothetical protein
MKRFKKTLNCMRRTAGRATILIVSTAACTIAAHSQTPPYLLFQYSTLTSSGNAITATWVPVVTASGTVYKDITLLFNLDSAGVLTLAPGYPAVVASPASLASSFKAGKYQGPGSMSNYVMTINGPGITTGGATEWSLAAVPGVPYYSYPISATWYVGPITSNPLAARLKAAGITSTAWSYGIANSACGCSQWLTNTLIGVSQTGNALTIVSFTSNGDHSEPIDQITYTLTP